MAKTDRTMEDMRIDLAEERRRAAEALDRLGNDVEDIIADLQRQAAAVGRKAAMVAPVVALAAGTLMVLRRRRRKRKAGGSAGE